jgi:MFS family permease
MRVTPAAGAVDVRPGVGAVYTVVLLCLANAFSNIDRSALSIVLPQIKSEMQLSDTVLGLVSGLPFALCYALCTLPAAWLADSVNRKYFFSAALAFWSLCTAFTAAVQNGLQLSIARFLLGAGESAGLPTTTSLIADLFTLRWRPIAFAMLSASAYLGPLLGFPVIGWLAVEYGWRSAFLAAGVGGLVLAFVFLLTVREPARGAVGGAKSVASPLISKAEFQANVARLLATRSFVWIAVSGALSAINFGSMLTWGPSFLARLHHLDPRSTAYYFGTVRGAAGMIGALLTGVLISALAQRDSRWIVRTPILLLLALFVADALFLFSASTWIWPLALAAGAFVSAACVAASYTLYVSVAPVRARATATAVYLVVASVTGQTLGPFIVGALADLLAGAFGVQSIAVAMLVASAAALPAAGALFMARHSWQRDIDQLDVASAQHGA